MAEVHIDMSAGEKIRERALQQVIQLASQLGYTTDGSVEEGYTGIIQIRIGHNILATLSSNEATRFLIIRGVTRVKP